MKDNRNQSFSFKRNKLDIINKETEIYVKEGRNINEVSNNINQVVAINKIKQTYSPCKINCFNYTLNYCEL